MNQSDHAPINDTQTFRKENVLRAAFYLYSPAFQEVVSSLRSILPGLVVWYVSEDGERIEFSDVSLSEATGDSDQIHLCEHNHKILEEAGRQGGTKGDVIITRCSHGRVVAAARAEW